MGCIGKVGMGFLLVMGQFNVMGGCEVGGFVNMLVCYLDIENFDYFKVVKDFWNVLVMLVVQGLKVVDMFDVVECGDIKVFWVICINLVQFLFDVDCVCVVIKGCDFVVVSDMYDMIDMVQVVDVVLFVSGWGEKFGIVINLDCLIS